MELGRKPMVEQISGKKEGIALVGLDSLNEVGWVFEWQLSYPMSKCLL